MPKYLNSNNFDVSLEGCVVAAGKTYSSFSDVPLDKLPSGVSKISSSPIWNPFIVSGVYAGLLNSDAVVEIPETYQGLVTEDLIDYKIDMYCITGVVDIYFNDKNVFTPPLHLIAGSGWSLTVKGRRVSSLILSSNVAFSVKVDISIP